MPYVMLNDIYKSRCIFTRNILCFHDIFRNPHRKFLRSAYHVIEFANCYVVYEHHFAYKGAVVFTRKVHERRIKVLSEPMLAWNQSGFMNLIWDASDAYYQNCFENFSLNATVVSCGCQWVDGHILSDMYRLPTRQIMSYNPGSWSCTWDKHEWIWFRGNCF